jgi:hypothetical protein
MGILGILWRVRKYKTVGSYLCSGSVLIILIRRSTTPSCGSHVYLIKAFSFLNYDPDPCNDQKYVLKDPDRAGSKSYWPFRFRNAGLLVRGSGPERNVYGFTTLLMC